MALETTKAAISDKSTLFNVVVSRSADVKLSPRMFTKHRLKADICKTSTILSCPEFPLFTPTPSKDESILTGGTKVTINLNQTKKITAVHDIADAAHAVPTPLSPFTSDVSNSKSPLSDITPVNEPTDPQSKICNVTSKMDSAASSHHSFTSCSHSARSSSRSTTESSSLQEKISRLKPGNVLIQVLCLFQGCFHQTDTTVLYASVCLHISYQSNKTYADGNKPDPIYTSVLLWLEEKKTLVLGAD